MSKSIFEQTNRTILFEEINSEKLDLLTLVGSSNNITSLDDEKIREIHEHLLIRNFSEFLTKFEPKVYSFFNAATQKVKYSLEKPNGIPDNCITEIPINMENTFFKMLITLLDSKKINGSKNVDFNFKEILNMLSPKKVMDDIKQLRKEIAYLHDKYESLEEEDPTKLEYADKLNIAFSKAGESYNNILGMLPLAIEDIKTRVLIGQSENGGKAEEIKIGMLTMDEHGAAYVKLTKELLAEHDTVPSEASLLVGCLGSVKDICAWVVFIEEGDQIRVRLRSKGPIINTLAKEFNGGGHPLASGATAYSWEEADLVIARLKEICKAYH